LNKINYKHQNIIVLCIPETCNSIIYLIFIKQECVSNLAGIIYKKTEDQVVEEKNTDHIILTSWNAFSVWACQLNNEICIQSAYDYYAKWQKGEK